MTDAKKNPAPLMQKEGYVNAEVAHPVFSGLL
jgi:hypothetical protein